MAREFADFAYQTGTTPSYPHGQLKDDPGDGTGTPLEVETLNDIYNFFHVLMDEAGIAFNNVADFGDSGYGTIQFYDAYLQAQYGDWPTPIVTGKQL